MIKPYVRKSISRVVAVGMASDSTRLLRPRWAAALAAAASLTLFACGGESPAQQATQPEGVQSQAVTDDEKVVGGEVINVHSCAPGYSDIGGTCWPNPLTEPSPGGGTPGTPGVGDDGESGVGGPGGEESPEDLKNGPPDPTKALRTCTAEQAQSPKFDECSKQVAKDLMDGVENPHYARCRGSKVLCCRAFKGEKKVGRIVTTVWREVCR